MSAPDYSSLSDDEVLRLATRPQDLTDEARSLLDAELSQDDEWGHEGHGGTTKEMQIPRDRYEHEAYAIVSRSE